MNERRSRACKREYCVEMGGGGLNVRVKFHKKKAEITKEWGL